MLENVYVRMTPTSEMALSEDFVLPIPSLTPSTSPAPTYVSFTRLQPSSFVLGSFTCTLCFTSKEVDPHSGLPEEEGYEDEYQLEEAELGVGGDWVVGCYAAFGSEWERLEKEGSVCVETFVLGGMESIKGSSLFLPFPLYLFHISLSHNWKSGTNTPTQQRP